MYVYVLKDYIYLVLMATNISKTEQVKNLSYVTKSIQKKSEFLFLNIFKTPIGRPKIVSTF